MPAVIPFVVAGAQVYAASVATSTIVAGCLYAAAACTVVGTLTENKDLTRLGTVLSLVGGIGSLSAESGGTLGQQWDKALLGSGESAAGSTVAAQAGATEVASNVAQNTNMAAEGATQSLDTATAGSNLVDASAQSLAAPSSSGVVTTADLAPNVAQSLTDAGSSLAGSTGQSGLISDTMGGSNSLLSNVNGSAPGDAFTNPNGLFGAEQSPSAFGQETGAMVRDLSTPAPATPDVAATANGASGLTKPTSLTDGAPAKLNMGTYANSSGASTYDLAQAGAKLPTLQSPDPTWYQKLATAINNNPGLAQTATGLITGGMNSYSQQKTAEQDFQRKKDYQEWLRQRYNDSLRNLTIPSLILNKNGSSGIISGARG